MEMTARRLLLLLFLPAMVFCLAVAGCGQATPEQAVYKFLGAVQSHDRDAMRSCVNPEALEKVAEGSGEIARQWEELYRRYMAEPTNWRMVFESIRLESSYLDSDRALVRLVGGRCELYNLKEGAWVSAGEIDFSTEDFVPLYVVERDGQWFLEALDLYVIFGLESAART
jgi:hypothetical protein